MTSRVEKVEVLVKGTWNGGAGPQQAVGSAGAPAAGMASWLRLPRNLGATTAVPAAFEFDAPQVGAFKQLLQQRGTDGPVRCISIAPDSAIESFDLIFGTGARERFTVSVGNPLVGIFDTDYMIVVPRMPFPNLALANGAIDLRTQAFWDANVVEDQNGIARVNWKGRLLLHRGDVIPPSVYRRAPLYAAVPFSTDPANGASTANDPAKLYVCTDGRRYVDFTAVIGTLTSGSPLLSIDIGDAKPTTLGLGDDEASTFSSNLLAVLPMTAGTPVVKSYAGNPAQFARMKITGTQACDGVMIIRAWD